MDAGDAAGAQTKDGAKYQSLAEHEKRADADASALVRAGGCSARFVSPTGATHSHRAGAGAYFHPPPSGRGYSSSVSV